MATKQARKDLTVTERMQVIDALEQKRTQLQIAKDFDISQTQVSRIKANKDAIRLEWENSTLPSDRRRKRKGKSSEVEEGLYVWFEQARAKNVPISGPILKEKATKIAEAMGLAWVIL